MAFFAAVIRNELNGPVWRRIVRFLKRLNWFVDLILGGGILALLLYLIYLYVPIASNKRWATIVILTCLVLLLSWFIRAVKRFHRTTIDEIYLAHQAITKRYADCADRIELLELILGRGDSLYFLLDNRRWNGGSLLSKEEIEYYEADVHNQLRGVDYTEAERYYHEKSAMSVETIYNQLSRLNFSREKVKGLIRSAKAQRQQIATEADSEKQKTLGRSLRANNA